ncbi:M24 family metallopeptidase [Lacticaseibacillus camelliae]|uniref:Proline dipeptidase n=2 Tax=Lacticaseibacillus camelliae TaxID=381742 RepID=A0A0R2F6L0_9LACO|nr:Xaa-Pro peptidase family protein [Lacticaseibacillus camelliae]KRN23067.1 proline dipeptidase [Lacticaseibacillus camelliae DSM 22697 = JCM 13995]
MNEHLTQLQHWVQAENLDVAYISNFTNINYFTGFFSDPEERVTGLFVFPDQEPLLFVPALSIEAVKKTGWPYAVAGYLDQEDPFALIADEIKKRSPQPLQWGIEKDDLAVFKFEAIMREFPQAAFPADASRFIEGLQLIKTPAEIAQMAEAGRQADRAFTAGFNALKTGITEQGVVAEIEYAMMKEGVMHMSFDTIVQAGVDAADPHGGPEQVAIKPGELVLFDLGTDNHGYMSDATRTVAFGQGVSEQAKELHKVCLEAQLAAQSAVRPGMRAAALDKIARDIIDKAGYGEYFNHRLGHGIGMSTHEYPSIMAGNQMELKPGMCFSIEPGIYVPGVAGVRIEDCVHVTETGCEPFTHTPKEFTVID